MKNFNYKAYDSSGTVKHGDISAMNNESAKNKLKEAGLIPVQISEAEETDSGLNEYFKIEFKPGINEIEKLSSRLALLLKNGIKVDRAIESTLKGIKNIRLKKIMSRVHDDIRRGVKLSDSLANYPMVFDTLYISMIRVGEETGDLAKALTDITESLSFHKSILSKTRLALVYPIIILMVCAVSVLFIFNFVVPKFSVIFAENHNLPAYTKMLISVSNFFRNYQFVFFPLLVLVGFLIYSNRNRDFVKKMKYLFVLNFPVFKKLSFTLENLRFASALSMLLSSGVVLSDALQYAVDSVSNIFIKKRLAMIKDHVRQGENLSKLLSDADFLPDMFDGLVEIGEQTGNLAEVFKEMEIRLKSDYEQSMAAMVTLIEPVMIIVMGLIIGSVVVVMFLSIISVNDINF